MENKVEKALEDFVETLKTDKELEEKTKLDKIKKVVLDERDGLIIERIDKQFITSDGRQLLREVY
jgi:hypothetical protein